VGAVEALRLNDFEGFNNEQEGIMKSVEILTEEELRLILGGDSSGGGNNSPWDYDDPGAYQ